MTETPAGRGVSPKHILPPASRRKRPLDEWPGRLRQLVRARLRRLRARERAAAVPPPPPAAPEPVHSLVLEVMLIATAISGAVFLLLGALGGALLALLGVPGEPVGLFAAAAFALALAYAAARWLRWLVRRVEEARHAG